MSASSTPDDARQDGAAGVPEDPKDWDLDITESDGPILEEGSDLDTGAAGGQRER